MVRLIGSLMLLVVMSVASLFSTSAHAEVTNIEAVVDKNPVLVNESFVLTVTFNDDVENGVFQPQQLLSNFIVGRTSVSRQTSIVNGTLNKMTRFSTVLIADQPGTYTIPSIMMDGVKSQPIEIEVLAAGSDTSDRADRVAFIEASVDNQTVFLQQPLTYIVRLYLAADLNKGNLMPPQMAHADIRQIGSDDESSKMINGRRYKVYQRTFQITPNKSGTFTIEGARFDGEVYAEGQRSIFSSFSNTQPVSAIGENISVTVKPVPDSWQGPWLPSELVTLSQSLAPDTDTIDVGEPLTVSYQLTAVGVKPEQLPPIKPDFPASVRIYPDNEATDQFVRNGVTIAQKTVSFAVVPNDPGKLTLPAVAIPWFNTKRDQRAIAKTEPVTLTVEGVANAQTPSAPVTPVPANKPAAPAADSAPVETAPVESIASQRVLWILVTLLVLSLVGNLAWLWRRNKRRPMRVTAANNQQQVLTGNQQWRNFQKACADNHARKADESLRKWAQQHFDQSLVSLGELARWLANGHAVDEELLQQLNGLQQSLFSATKPTWTEGKTLYQCLRRALDRRAKPTKNDALPKLYN